MLVVFRFAVHGVIVRRILIGGARGAVGLATGAAKTFGLGDGVAEIAQAPIA